MTEKGPLEEVVEEMLDLWQRDVSLLLWDLTLVAALEFHLISLDCVDLNQLKIGSHTSVVTLQE